jgi:hypothetical protein
MIPEYDIDYDYEDYDRGFIDNIDDETSSIMDDIYTADEQYEGLK